MRSTAPYELMAALLAKDGLVLPSKLVMEAFGASDALWERALALESCAVQLDRALRASALAGIAPSFLCQRLSEATARAVRQALTAPGQLTELANAARELGIRIMVLKGAARLVEGEIPGSRSMADIDVLTSPHDAARLHAFLRRDLGYEPMSAAPEHHLPTLMRAGALPIEVHIQLGPRLTALDARIWRDPRAAPGMELMVPSSTSALLHALEHATLVHWALRYRLRDLLDVAEAWRGDVDLGEVAAYVRTHPQHVALTTILGAARRFSPDVSLGHRAGWRTVRRVAHVRHFLAAHVGDASRAKSLCIAGGVLAEASPRALLRPASLALFGVKQARISPLSSSSSGPGAWWRVLMRKCAKTSIVKRTASLETRA